MNNYHITEIGRSKDSVVYKGRLKKTIEYLAIKSSEKEHKLKVMNEVRILQNLAHENIIKYHAWHKTRNHFWLVVEYCPGGDILTLIDQDKSLPEKVIQDFGINIMDGLYYLHSQGVIYADLKPSNILFNEYGVLKLCDFGLARLVTDEQSEDNKKGTPYYMAPELFEEGGVYSYYSDLWSFGCVLYELAVGTPPFVSSTFKDLKEQILSAETPTIPGFSATFNDLVAGLLQKDPSKRTGWEELLWHEFWEGSRMIEVSLPLHSCYEDYLKSRGLVQRTRGHKRESYKFDARESLRASLNGKENFVIKSRDQVFNLGENWDIDQRESEVKILHQRSNSAVLQTPNVKTAFKPQPLDQLLIHSSDLHVKPIIGSHEHLNIHTNFSFSIWTPENISNDVNDSELESHFSEVYSLLTSNEKQETKMTYLAYIEYLIEDFPLANKLINSAFVSLFLKLFTSKSPEMQGRICSLFGQMLRHATIIDSDLPNSELCEAFTGIIEKEDNKKSLNSLRKKAFAALGEYLFFAATQMDEEEYDEAWNIQGQVVEILSKEIVEGNDLDCVFLAVRTVENITAQSKNGGIIFATKVRSR
jgi:serine/threonine-protein kinase ULK4